IESSREYIPPSESFNEDSKDGSIENFSDHLQNKYGITKFEKSELDIFQLTLDEKFRQLTRNNVAYKEQVDRALVKFIITDSQPFYLLESPRFIKYSIALELSYEISHNKGIKNKIYLAYNWITATLSWIRILKLKPAIEIMYITISHNNDSATKKDAQRLKRIMLTPNKWQLIDDLVKILQPLTISSLKKLLNVNINNNMDLVIVDFNDSNSAFSDNLDLEEEIEFADEPEILDVKTEKKINQIKINTSQK
ncbi:25006_t:CDS:2, partial [Racocetra persica]